MMPFSLFVLLGAQQISIYHTQVMRSSSMPFPVVNRTVEKSASTEFRFRVPIESRPLAGNERKPTYVISAAPNHTAPSATHHNPYALSTNNNPIFYKPASQNNSSNLSLPQSNTNSSNNSSGNHNSYCSSSGNYLLPDIGAPDVTDELYRGERRPSSDSTRSTGSQRQQWSGSNSEISMTTTSEISSARPSKAVFYTHSMKKKSTEPKFV